MGDDRMYETLRGYAENLQTIDGQEFTVLIHLSEIARETAKDRMNRILAKEAKKGCDGKSSNLLLQRHSSDLDVPWDDSANRFIFLKNL